MSKQAKVRLINVALKAVSESFLTHGNSPEAEQALAFWQKALAKAVSEKE